MLVSPGVYRETVVVEKPRLVVRGLDRAGVIIDGEHKRENGIKVLADGVAVENLTVRNNNANGVLVSGDDYGNGGGQLRGFRVAYVTAQANDLYGVYSYAAQDGAFDHVYASGSGDAGVYVGRCTPCNTLVVDSLAEHNAVGFEGTNASGGLVVARSVWRANRVGITVNSQKLERKAPQHDAVIVGNLVDGSGAEASPAQGRGAFGLGIAIGGGTNDLVARNRVVGSKWIGIVVTSLDGFVPSGVRLDGNVLTGNALDVSVYRTDFDIPGSALCFIGNEITTAAPLDLVSAHPCGGPPGPSIASGPPVAPDVPRGIAPDQLPSPPPLDNLPDGATRTDLQQTGGVAGFDVAAVAVPEP